MKSFRELNRQLEGFRAMAKKNHHITDYGLSRMVGTSVSNIRNKSHDEALPNMPFWMVVKLVRAGGGDIELKAVRNEKN